MSPKFVKQQAVRRSEWFERFELAAKTRFPMNDELIAQSEAVWQKSFDEQVTDDYVREVLTPKYRFGCKRPLFGTDYYPTFRKPNVQLIGRGVTKVVDDCIVDSKGDRYPVDVVIWATGYKPADMLGDLVIKGGGGQSLSEEWSDGPHAYYGTMVAGFENLFLMHGPNAGSAAATDMLEATAALIRDAIVKADALGASVVEVDKDVYRAFNREMEERCDASVLAKGNCRSYYRVGGTGRIFTHWPDTVESFQRRIRTEALSGLRFR